MYCSITFKGRKDPQDPEDGQTGNDFLQDRLHSHSPGRQYHRSLQMLEQRNPEF